MKNEKCQQSKRVFVITSGLFIDINAPQVVNRFTDLSEKLEGDVAVVDSRRFLNKKKIGNFQFNVLRLPMWVRNCSVLRNIIYWNYCVTRFLINHYFKKKYDVIWVSDPFNNGVIACLMKFFSGTPVFLEVIGNIELSMNVGRAHATIFERLKSRYANYMAPKVLNYVDSVRLVYPHQVDFLNPDKPAGKYRYYPGYVPIARLLEKSGDAGTKEEGVEDYILLLGGPWFLKGVDLLLEAFSRVAKDYPDLHLKIVGYEPLPDSFLTMATPNERIEFNNEGVGYLKAMELIKNAKVFVLASRTEAYARVLTESMALKTPIVASAVDGVPTYVRQDFNGLLFESENVDSLEQAIRRLLVSPALAEQLTDNGFEYVKETISEKNYVENIASSIASALEASAQ